MKNTQQHTHEKASGTPEAPQCSECGNTFDDNPRKTICKTCEDWQVTGAICLGTGIIRDAQPPEASQHMKIAKSWNGKGFTKMPAQPSSEAPMERVIGNRARTYHWSQNGKTLCGKTAIMMSRVALGQRGDGLPPCLKCAEIRERKSKLLAQPSIPPLRREKHSPLPWNMEVQNGYINILDAKGQIVIADYDINADPSVGIRVDFEREVGNFELLVRACNAYPHAERLAEACEMVEGAIRWAKRTYGPDKWIKHITCDWNFLLTALAAWKEAQK